MFFVELDKIFENPIEYDNNFVYKWEKVYYTILQSVLNEKRMIISISQSIGRSKLDEILYNVFYRIILQSSTNCVTVIFSNGFLFNRFFNDSARIRLVFAIYLLLLILFKSIFFIILILHYI